MPIEMIMAVATNGVIGNRGAMPWRLRDDLRRFKKLTTGFPVIMGRRTWDSLPRKPLPARKNIVLTNSDLGGAGAVIAHTPERALQAAHPAEKIMIIGGAQIYTLFEPMAQRIHLTQICASIAGDTYFHLNLDDWHIRDKQSFSADTENSHDYCFMTLERKDR